jgi:hypothetical protein
MLTEKPIALCQSPNQTKHNTMLRRLVGGAAAVRSPLPPPFCRLLHNGGGGGGCSSGEPESVAYRMSMLRRPSTVSKKGLTWNWCSLIGRLAAPVRPIDTSFLEVPRAYTFLSVTLSSPAPSSSSSNIKLSPSLRIPLSQSLCYFLSHFLQSYLFSPSKGFPSKGLLGYSHPIGIERDFGLTRI